MPTAPQPSWKRRRSRDLVHFNLFRSAPSASPSSSPCCDLSDSSDKTSINYSHARMAAITTLPPELLQMIILLLIPMNGHPRTSSITIELHIIGHPYANLNSLSRTCYALHRAIEPLLFQQYIRRPNGDDIGLIFFCRALLNYPPLCPLVQSLQIDDNGCLSSPSSPYAPRCQEARVTDPWWMQTGGRPAWEEGREIVPTYQRTVDDRAGGCRFPRQDGERGWGSFAALGEDDWVGRGLMSGKEWEGLEGRVYEICGSRAFSTGSGEDRELSAVDLGRQLARIEKGMGYTWDDPRKGLRNVETPKDAQMVGKLHVRTRFGLKSVKRPTVGKGVVVSGVDDDQVFDGWRYDSPPPPSYYTPPMIARRWLRALRRGSRDAWSALLLCLASGTRKLMAMASNWFARPDPHNPYDMLGPEEIKAVEERYREEDEEWEALGGYTWVGWVMRGCAVNQAYYRELWMIHQEAVASRETIRRSRKRKRPMVMMGIPDQHPFPRQMERIRILPQLQEVILASSPSLTAHPNLSLNTLLHFLQPPSITHATICGLSDATFGIHERKPPGILQTKFGLKALILQNCNASASCIGFLLSLCPGLISFAHRGCLRKLFHTPTFPELDPGELVQYLRDYCPHLKVLDLDTGNEYDQHALNRRFCDLQVKDFKRLARLEVLECRVEHVIPKRGDEGSESPPLSSSSSSVTSTPAGYEVGEGWITDESGEEVLGPADSSTPSSDSPSDSDNGASEYWSAGSPNPHDPLILLNVFPNSLKRLVIGTDSLEGKKILDPLLVWIEGMTKRPVHRFIEGGTKLEALELRCGYEWVKDGMLFDGRFMRLVNKCHDRGIEVKM